MQIAVSDIQVVGETEAQLFEFLNQGTTDALLFLSNLGVNTINYRFQQFSAEDQEWQDLVADPDDDLYGTLLTTRTRSIKLTVANPKVRLVGNASGGSTLWFSVSRFVVRASGGAMPILNF